jgi:hypothetical protein
MYLTTPEQERLYTIIDKTGCMTTAQAERILPQKNPDAPESFSARVLRQLQYQQKVRFVSESVLTLPHLVERAPDRDMLAAVDIMLDITNGAPMDMSVKTPPFKLCFLAEQNGQIGSYGIIIAVPGNERRLNFQLEGTERRTVIFLLTSPKQSEKIQTTLPHYFAVADCGKYRYFKSE